MEYHKDRFQDCSFMIFNEKNRLLALLPASVSEDVLTTHSGLTFGGFLVDSKMTVEMMLELFSLLKSAALKLGINHITQTSHITNTVHMRPAKGFRGNKKA